MKLLLLFLLCLFCYTANSQPYQGSDKPILNPRIKSASCTPPTTTTTLDYNNVDAQIHTAGNLWQIPGLNLSQYEVPKNSGIMALFTSALWLGGVDVNNQLKLAALRYKDGQDYWTGPLSQGAAETNYDNCNWYDQHFVTTQDIIREFVAWFQAGEYDAVNGTNTQTEAFPGYEVPNIIKEWPAHGDITQGQDYYLAPFYDVNEDGDYDWEEGDYPWYDLDKTKECTSDRRVSLYGDQNFWWIMNDKGNIHTETGADPIGLEIRAQAFAFATNDQINNMTFYNYELINRGTQTLYNTYFGCFTDGALGDPFDDFVGCDVNRGLAYYYNGDNNDDDNQGFFGYGENPPAVGVDFFEGPYQDNDGIDNAFGIGPNEALNGIGYGDSIIDNERFGMRRFIYYSNTTNGADPSQTDPIDAPDYYNYLRGFWKDASPFYYGGSGHISDPEADPTVPCDFMFPGDTDPLGWGTGGVPQEPWTEESAGNVPNDRRFVQSAGPFILKPGAVNNITVGVVWAQSTGGGPFAAVEALRIADDKAQALFENCFRIIEGPHAPNLNIQELENSLILTLSNPPNSNNRYEDYIEVDPFISFPGPEVDKEYRFQGYQIFQLVDDAVSVSELGDITKSRMVAQCDLKDGVSRLINFEFNEELGISIATEMVDGEDDGIRHSFLVTEDQFAQGDRRLVNFKRYHYMAISYAHNEYAPYDPEDPTALLGQKKPYLSSRKAASGEVKPVEAIPHNPMPEADGTGQLIEYGSSPEITRIEGVGNGGRIIELTKASRDFIVANGRINEPTYQKGKGPINIKVIDPLNVQGGYYELKFENYDSNTTNSIDTASWTINRYESEGGQLIETVNSTRTIEVGNEQLITDWGISVMLEQAKDILPSNGSNTLSLRSDFLTSSIYFTDSSKRWLSGVNDNNSFFPTNWVRSGIYEPEPDDCLPDGLDYLNPCNYADSDADKDLIFGNVLNGTIAPHKITGYEASFMPLAYYNYPSPVLARERASLSFLPSVDIIITSDTSKWTRCPVIELGREQALNDGNADFGGLRASQSVDKEGNPDNSGTTGMGWFPGYAIDLESGARLYLAFGENSFLASDNGRDMIWNPSSRIVDNTGNPVFGGQHPVYIFSYKMADVHDLNSSSFGNLKEYVPSEGKNPATNVLYQNYLNLMSGAPTSQKNVFYSSLSWVYNAMGVDGRTTLSSDVEIKLRVTKEYKDFTVTGKNNGKPMYSWNMDEISTELGNQDRLVNALDLINVVPNPYLAYSEYERNRIDSRIKITNLPERCTIKIYSSNGKLIKKFEKDSPQTYLDWLLLNEKGIFIASGVYLIHVDVPGAGEVVLKSFVAMRQVDLQNL